MNSGICFGWQKSWVANVVGATRIGGRCLEAYVGRQNCFVICHAYAHQIHREQLIQRLNDRKQ